MTVPDKNGKCHVCQPIKNLLEILKAKGFEIVNSECTDVHYHEVSISTEGGVNSLNPNIVMGIEKISISENGTFYCECHWSTVSAKMARVKKSLRQLSMATLVIMPTNRKDTAHKEASQS